MIFGNVQKTVLLASVAILVVDYGWVWYILEAQVYMVSDFA